VREMLIHSKSALGITEQAAGAELHRAEESWPCARTSPDEKGKRKIKKEISTDMAKGFASSPKLARLVDVRGRHPMVKALYRNRTQADRVQEATLDGSATHSGTN
jgi:hypothetical protein